MAARLDTKSLESLRKISGIQELSDEALSKYYYLACVHGISDTFDRKRQLVIYTPEMAAQIAYHFGDIEIGSMLVMNYSEHPDKKLRQLATYIRDILHKRILNMDRLEKILGT